MDELDEMEELYYEYPWAYDWWLKVRRNWKFYHRLGSEIIEEKQKEEYWPVYFHTKDGYFRNFTPITKEQYDR